VAISLAGRPKEAFEWRPWSWCDRSRRACDSGWSGRSWGGKGCPAGRWRARHYDRRSVTPSQHRSRERRRSRLMRPAAGPNQGEVCTWCHRPASLATRTGPAAPRSASGVDWASRRALATTRLALKPGANNDRQRRVPWKLRLRPGPLAQDEPTTPAADDLAGMAARAAKARRSCADQAVGGSAHAQPGSPSSAATCSGSRDARAPRYSSAQSPIGKPSSFTAPGDVANRPSRLAWL
jgi:hypothetical protein